MKKIGIILALFCLTYSTVDAQYKDNAIKLNLFGVLVGQYQVGYEMAMSEKVSVQLSAGLVSRSDEIAGFWESSTSGFLVIPEARLYFSEALKGAYAGAFFRYRSATTTVDYLDIIGGDFSYEDKRSAIGGGITLGYQFLISDALVLDIFLGPQFKSVNSERTYKDDALNDDPLFQPVELDIAGVEDDGVGLRFGINFGYAF